MPTDKQRRAAERRRLQRQLERRREREQRRRRLSLITSIVGALAIVGVVVGFLIATHDDDKTPAAAPKSTSPSSSAPAASTSAAPALKATTGACKYQPVAARAGLRNVGVPPDPPAKVTTDEQVTFTTNRGVIKATLDGKDAPCNVQALTYLISKKFYDNTPCPRVVDSGIFVVQCGSGGASTAGGPTFTSPDENTAKADYSAGAIAMANTGGANTGSSQFFFITQDSNTGLQKSYSLVGHVTQGLPILQQVAKGGDDGSSGTVGGGKPKLSLVFEKVTVRPVAG